MQTEVKIAALAGTVIVLSALWLCRRRDDDDAASGTHLGHDHPSELGPHAIQLTAAQCSVCRKWRCADHQWRAEADTERPEEFGFGVQASHTYCPPCLREQTAAAERYLSEHERRLDRDHFPARIGAESPSLEVALVARSRSSLLLKRAGKFRSK